MTDVNDIGSADADRREGALGAIRRHLGAAFGAVGNTLAPSLCLACHNRTAAHDALCSGCWQQVTFITPPLCHRLGLPLPFGSDGPQISAAAAADPPPYDRARAAAVFDGVIRELIHGFKYADRHEVRRLLARWMSGAGTELLADAHLIVPVPMTRWRLMRRQFNQAALLAREISRLSGVPFDPFALTKTKSTPTQVGSSAAQRAANVTGAFAVSRAARERVAGRNVIVIDDVITTGATVGACARALRAAGAARIDVLAAAMVADPRRVDL
ncbi:MAG: ComF family protein [Hyphomicrobium sp.]|nr:ComF family protein [Hyphomicrobium sp.]